MPIASIHPSKSTHYFQSVTNNIRYWDLSSTKVKSQTSWGSLNKFQFSMRFNASSAFVRNVSSSSPSKACSSAFKSRMRSSSSGVFMLNNKFYKKTDLKQRRNHHRHHRGYAKRKERNTFTECELDFPSFTVFERKKLIYVNFSKKNVNGMMVFL